MKKLFAILFIGMMHIGLASECYDMVKEHFTIEPFKSKVGARSVKSLNNRLKDYDGEDREECEKYIISSFEGVCAKLVTLRGDGLYDEIVWLEDCVDMYVETFNRLKILKESPDALLRIARALSLMKVQNQEPKSKGVKQAEEYGSYVSSVKMMRTKLIFTCCCRFYYIRKQLDKVSYNEFIEEFADAAKMTKEERENMSRRLDGLDLKW